MKKISPINRSKDQARRYYDRISHIYDWLTAGENRLIQKGVDFLGVKPGERIADIGCGTGAGIKFIQNDLSQSGIVIGVDLSHQMLLESQNKIKTDNQGHSLVQGDAVKLPIKSGKFDGILCTFTLELFAEREIPLVLNEFNRVLKKGGRLVIVSLAQDPKTIAVEIYEWLHKVFPVVVDCRPIPLTNLLSDVGFEIRELQKDQYWGLPIKSALCLHT